MDDASAPAYTTPQAPAVKGIQHHTSNAVKEIHHHAANASKISLLCRRWKPEVFHSDLVLFLIQSKEQKLPLGSQSWHVWGGMKKVHCPGGPIIIFAWGQGKI